MRGKGAQSSGSRGQACGEDLLSRSLADVEKSFIRHYKGIEVKFVNLTDLIDALKK